MIYLLILGGLLLRFIFSFLPAFNVDMFTWYAWADRLVNLGFTRFYDPLLWTHYTPGYFYILWLLGFIKKTFVINDSSTLLQLFKLPSNLADILTAVLIYKIVVKKSGRWWAILGLILYLFNPALIFNSSVWGQVDSILALLMLVAIYLLLENKIVFSSIASGLAFLVKPQAIFILPVIVVFLLKKKNLKQVIKFLLPFLATSILLAWPFFNKDPILGLPKLISQMGNDYAYTTLNAFNFWQLFGNFQPDQTLLFGISKNLLGTCSYLFITLATIFFMLRLKDIKKEKYYFAAALFLFIFFLFPTRIHERYLLPMLPFLLLAGSLYKSILLALLYWLLSVVHFINIFYVYNHYYPDHLKNSLFEGFSLLPIVLSALTLLIFMLLFSLFLRKTGPPKVSLGLGKQLNKWWQKLVSQQESKEKQFKIVSVKKANLYIGIILLLAFGLRIWNIWHPRAYIFDEVYHGFTAQEIAKGNIKAWEWWNSPPQGFAYEWTHPPLAKLIMAGSILLFGHNDGFSQYAFRVPGVFFGIGVIYLTYLLAKEIFKNERLALLAAFLLSFDGLAFVMSRVGMVDIYALFFLLLTIYLSLTNKYFWSAISLGLAVGTKWTGVYLYPVVGAIMLSQIIGKMRSKKQIATLFNNYIFKWLIEFGIIPPVIYILCNLPFFLTGHSWSQFIELQRQMWWYHTNLKATHAYQSTALTWPFLIRPVWFWVDYKPQTIANIYNLGNPLIWWSGLLVIPLAIYQAIEDIFSKKIYRLGLVMLCYFAFWIPWVFSPRIMFLHHYLPAIPFLCILLAYFLDKIYDVRFKPARQRPGIYEWKISGKLLVTVYLLLITCSFIFFYPIYAGLPVSKELVKYFFWLPTWK